MEEIETEKLNIALKEKCVERNTIRYLEAKMIRETRIEGRRKHYIITELGKEKLIKERKRLKLMLDDGRILE